MIRLNPSRTQFLLRPDRSLMRALMMAPRRQLGSGPLIRRERLREENHHRIDQVSEDAAARDEHRTAYRAKRSGEPLEAVNLDEGGHDGYPTATRSKAACTGFGGTSCFPAQPQEDAFGFSLSR